MLVNLNDVLKKAQDENYAVGLFNTTDTGQGGRILTINIYSVKFPPL